MGIVKRKKECAFGEDKFFMRAIIDADEDLFSGHHVVPEVLKTKATICLFGGWWLSIDRCIRILRYPTILFTFYIDISQNTRVHHGCLSV